MIRFIFLMLGTQLLLTGNPNPANVHYQKEKLTEGEHKSYHTNGKPKEEFTIKNGNLHGTLRVWFKNGQLLVISHFDNGTYIDTCKEFYENGNVKNMAAYRHDTLLYYCEYDYYNDGSKNSFRELICDKDSLILCPFLKGSFSPASVEFDVNLTVADMTSRGQYVEYFKSGAVHLEVKTVRNKYEGEYRQYGENGKIIYAGTYHNDLMDGIFTYYNQDGSTTIENWEKGKRIRK